MEQPLISVIIPVYNIIEYLPRCVHSVTEQTWRNLEILLVDDGSTDGTGDLCDALAKEDDRICVFHKENGGSSSARNLALREAKGEYFGFVDSDDYIDKDMYQRLYEGIAQYDVPIAQIGRDEIDAQGNLLPNICEPPTEPIVFTSEEFMRELLMHRGDCSFCTKLVHRDLFRMLPDAEQDGVESDAAELDAMEMDGTGPDAVEPEATESCGTEQSGTESDAAESDDVEQICGFPEGKLNEDFHLLVRMLPKAEKIVSLPGQTYHVFYRVGSNSRKATREDFSRVYGDCVDNADMAAQIVAERYPTLEQTALRFGVFQRLEYMLHIPISRMKRENAQYRAVVRWLRANWGKAMRNPYLTGKNKLYHTLFAVSPAGIRKLHRMLRKNRIT